MQTFFEPTQLEQPMMQHMDEILRNCVHCGMCTATCPTYLLEGNELDSPRGRIYLMKQMFEQDAVNQRVQTHLDKCLSCLSCMTTCPSGVDYMHLVDQGRAKLETELPRKRFDHYLRQFLCFLLPKPSLFRMSLILAKLSQPFHKIIKKTIPNPQIHALLDMVPDDLPPPSAMDKPSVHYPDEMTQIQGRVAIWPGCAQQVLAPNINEAAMRLLLKMGFIVEVPALACCGALPHHLGKAEKSHAMVKHNVEILYQHHAKTPYDAIISTTSGCGTTLKDYDHILANEDESLYENSKMLKGLTKDISEFIYAHRTLLSALNIKKNNSIKAKTEIAFHPPCSLQHGQKLQDISISLMEEAGFKVKLPKESHICCGSAGVYNILQPKIANQLRTRKQTALRKLNSPYIVTNNIGCIKQIAKDSELRPLHLIELLADHYLAV